jgi:preprotein translocase subunit SecA
MSKIERAVAKALAKEQSIRALTDGKLREIWEQWSSDLVRRRVRMDAVLADVLALVREAAFRATGLMAFPCQVRAAVVLTEPAIAEVATGEGKTLITAMAACLFALYRRGVHVATVNTYLAERDFEFACKVAERLGLTVGQLTREQSQAEKRAAYMADITYGTGYDFGFDYLRDQLALLKHSRAGPALRLRNILLGREQREVEVVQRQLAYAIVDEIDSVLIDEAASPLVISQAAPRESSSQVAYHLAHEATLRMREGADYTLDPRGKNAQLTESGKSAGNALSGVPWDSLVRPWHIYLKNALNAQHVFHLGEHYIIQKGKVVIVDEFTGRAHEERSWQQGLHQAVAAKEGLEIPQETQSAASITRQRYFGLYKTLCGLTGTALESRKEFRHFFQLPVREIAPNRPCQRLVSGDSVYSSRDQMLVAVAADVEDRWKMRQPVLVGTRTITISEALSAHLTERGIPHRILNARQDSGENDIIAQAGELGSVVVATNMAGRGTHISLPEESIKLGGLHVIGVERSESSRVDRQLAGRCARQGQPGSAKFFVSAEDNLVEQFDPGLARQLQRMTTDQDGRLPDEAARLFSQLQVRVQKIRYLQRLQLERRDQWTDQTRKSLA